MNDGSGLKYLLTDHLGSVVAITDDQGDLISQQRYLPFGGTRELPNQPASGLTDYGYTGQRNLDEDLGLMDYKARFYSPVLNRFIQPDTIVPNPMNPQAYNRFSYVVNSPINLNDPTGHAYCDFINSQNKDDCEGGLANSQSSSVIWKKKDKEKEKNNNDCETVVCKALNGDIKSIVNLIIPTHLGWRSQIEVTTFSAGFWGFGFSGTIGSNLAINRVSKEIAWFVDGSGEFGVGGGTPWSISLTAGPLVGWGSSTVNDIARGSAATIGATSAYEAAFSISASAPVEDLNPMDGLELHVDPKYGTTPATIFAGAGVGLAYGGAGGGGGQVFAGATLNLKNLSNSSACFINC